MNGAVLLGFRELVLLLRELRGYVGQGEIAALRIAHRDPAVSWQSFPTAFSSLPGADIGQSGDARFSLPDGASLHVQRFRTANGDFLELHVDEQDPLVSPIEHAAHATYAFEYGLWGGLGVSLATLLLTGDAKAARSLGSVGVGTGFVVGANTPKQRRRVFPLSDLIAAWRISA